MESNRKVSVIGIIVSNREEAAGKVNAILSDFGHIIVGRMGLPYEERGISVLSIIVDGTNEEIGALSGKLGNLKGVKAKVAVMH